VIALVLSTCPTQTDYNGTRMALLEGCSQAGLKRPETVCEVANYGSSPLKFPNNEYGNGLVNALNSVGLARKLGSCRRHHHNQPRHGKNFSPSTSSHRNGLANSQQSNLWYPKSWAEISGPRPRSIRPISPSFIIPILP